MIRGNQKGSMDQDRGIKYGMIEDANARACRAREKVRFHMLLI